MHKLTCPTCSTGITYTLRRYLLGGDGLRCKGCGQVLLLVRKGRAKFVEALLLFLTLVGFILALLVMLLTDSFVAFLGTLLLFSLCVIAPLHLRLVARASRVECWRREHGAAEATATRQET